VAVSSGADASVGTPMNRWAVLADRSVSPRG
jgi:hypothetical protein